MAAFLLMYVSLLFVILTIADGLETCRQTKSHITAVHPNIIQNLCGCKPNNLNSIRDRQECNFHFPCVCHCHLAVSHISWLDIQKPFSCMCVKVESMPITFQFSHYRLSCLSHTLKVIAVSFFFFSVWFWSHSLQDIVVILLTIILFSVDFLVLQVLTNFTVKPLHHKCPLNTFYSLQVIFFQ